MICFVYYKAKDTGFYIRESLFNIWVKSYIDILILETIFVLVAEIVENFSLIGVWVSLKSKILNSDFLWMQTPITLKIGATQFSFYYLLQLVF